jgi:hypothetical protein
MHAAARTFGAAAVHVRLAHTQQSVGAVLRLTAPVDAAIQRTIGMARTNESSRARVAAAAAAIHVGLGSVQRAVFAQ